ncbi:hypothetical protein WDW89_14255 [Deltaproteobacteria bacterium TL4]
MTFSHHTLRIRINALALMGLLLLGLWLPIPVWAQSEGSTGIYYESLSAKNRLKLGNVDEEDGFFEDTRIHLSELSGKFHRSIIDNISWGLAVGVIRAIGTAGNTKITTAGPLVGVEVVFGQLTELTFGYEIASLEDVIFTSIHPITGEHRFYRTDGNFKSMYSSLGLAFEMTDKALIKFYIAQKQAELMINHDQLSVLNTMYNGAGMAIKILF